MGPGGKGEVMSGLRIQAPSIARGLWNPTVRSPSLPYSCTSVGPDAGDGDRRHHHHAAAAAAAAAAAVEPAAALERCRSERTVAA